jgi:hypothetical protein
VRTVTELSQQTVQLQEELKRTKNDLKVSNIQVVDLRNALEELKNEMMAKVSGKLCNVCSIEKNLELSHRFVAWLNLVFLTGCCNYFIIKTFPYAMSN